MVVSTDAKEVAEDSENQQNTAQVVEDTQMLEDAESFTFEKLILDEDSDAENIEDHPNNAPPTNSKECPICLKEFSELWKHILESHTEKAPKQCPLCDKEFATKQRLTKHILVHTGERPYPCSLCNQSYKDEWSLKQHIEKCHSSKVTCPECLKSYESEKDLHAHFVKHTQERPYKCNYCSRDSKFKANIVRHIEEKHPQQSRRGVSIKEGSIFAHEAPWKIAKSATKPANRNKRVKVLARDAKRWKCRNCPNAFSFKSHLVIHSVTHTGERPFSCNECALTFTNKSQATRHIKQLHPTCAVEESLHLNGDTEFARLLQSCNSPSEL